MENALFSFLTGHSRGHPASLRNLSIAFRAVALLLLLFSGLYGMHAWEAAKDFRYQQLAQLAAFAARAAEQFFDQYAGAENFLGQVLQDGTASDPRKIHALLRLFKHDHPDLASVDLLAPDGTLVASSESSSTPGHYDAGADEASRPNWQSIKSATSLVVLPPQMGSLAKTWVIPMQMPIRNAKGHLRFIVSANLLLSNHQTIWRSLVLPKASSIGLIRQDGRLQSRWPDAVNDAVLYKNIRHGALTNALTHNPARKDGFFTGSTPEHPTARLGAYHHMDHYPFTAFVSFPMRQVWNDWLKRVEFAFGLLAALALFGTLIYRKAASLQKTLEEERRQSEAAMDRLNGELERRVEQRSAELLLLNKEFEGFCYSIAHDLRTPLRAIDGFSLVLLEDYPDTLDEEAKTYLQRVRAAGQRLAQLMDDLLSLSRVSRHKLHPQTVDLSALAQDIIKQLFRLHPQRRMEIHIVPQMQASGDPYLLNVALEHLIDNAWKFSIHRETALIEIGMLDSGGEAVYYVRDNGIGIDMQFADKLFGAFQRLHRIDEFQGTGIGLAMTQRIIKRHGGRIWVESSPDNGATFYFTLHARQADMEPRPEPPAYSRHAS